MGQTAQSLTCFITEKPHIGLGDCLNMLLSCFRKRMSGLAADVRFRSFTLNAKIAEDGDDATTSETDVVVVVGSVVVKSCSPKKEKGEHLHGFWPPRKASVVMQRLSYLTETVVANKIINNIIVLAFKDSPPKHFKTATYSLWVVAAAQQPTLNRSSSPYMMQRLLFVMTECLGCGISV